MILKDIDEYLGKLLNIDDFSSIDVSKNGLQIDNDGSPIKKIAFAVDASLQTIKRSISLGASLLFVHHGIFWKEPLMIVGSHYNRIKEAIYGNLGLYAVHLPLDAHHIYGNNAGLADRIDLEKREKFAIYKGYALGVMGQLKDESKIDALIPLLFPEGEVPSHILPFGNSKIKTVGILSGSGSSYLKQAIKLNLDLYVTGEIKHELYNEALEAHINIIAGGHYNTEKVGVSLIQRKIETDFGIETCFIDAPTGL